LFEAVDPTGAAADGAPGLVLGVDGEVRERLGNAGECRVGESEQGMHAAERRRWVGGWVAVAVRRVWAE